MSEVSTVTMNSYPVPVPLEPENFAFAVGVGMAVMAGRMPIDPSQNTAGRAFRLKIGRELIEGRLVDDPMNRMMDAMRQHFNGDAFAAYSATCRLHALIRLVDTGEVAEWVSEEADGLYVNQSLIHAMSQLAMDSEWKYDLNALKAQTRYLESQVNSH